MQVILSLFADLVALLTRFAVFIAIAVIGGFGSAWVMIHSGSRLSLAQQGSWVSWPQSGRPDAEPYTRAHTVRLALLPLNPSLGMTWHARTDADGQRIHSSCDYRIDVDLTDAQWWSIAVFDDAGRVVPNAAQRYAFNTATVLRESNGRSTLTLARDARPGNWLPTGGAGNLTLALFVQDPRWVQQAGDDAGGNTGTSNRGRILPAITKLACPR